MNLSDKKVFITGASAGIGKALLQELVNNYYVKQVAVMGRRTQPLNQLKIDFPEVQFLLIQGDISSPSDLDDAFDTIKAEWGGLDILINNAGVVSAGLLNEMTDEDIINQVNINLTGVLLTTKRAIPLLKESKEGALINVSSGLGYIARPFYSVYASTKAAIRQLSDAMRRELFQYPIHVMTIYPTATDTPMMKNAVVSGMDDPRKVAEESIKGLIDRKSNVIFGGEQRIQDIHTNFNDPSKIDEKMQGQFDALKERTKNHRAM